MDFFFHICETYNVKSSGTTKVYIRQFQQLYTYITGRYMDRNDAKEVYKVCHEGGYSMHIRRMLTNILPVPR